MTRQLETCQRAAATSWEYPSPLYCLISPFMPADWRR